MEKNCKVCNCGNDRTEINKMIMEGFLYREIIDKFPQHNLSSSNIARHKKHMDESLHDDSYRKHLQEVVQKLERQFEEGEIDFIPTVKYKLERIYLKACEMLGEYVDACTTGIESPRKLQEVVNAMQKMMDMLDTISGLRQKASIDSAIETITSAGYKVVGNVENKPLVEKVPPNLDEFKTWMRNYETEKH